MASDTAVKARFCVEPQINQRLFAGEFEPQQDDKRPTCHEQEPLDIRGIPALALPLRQGNEQTHEKHRQREQASEVEGAFDGLTGVGDHQTHQPHTQEPWQQIHVEHHAPAQILRHVAADHGPYCRPKADAMPYRPMARPRCLGGKASLRKTMAMGVMGPPPMPCNAEKNERRAAPGDAAEHRAAHKGQ